MTVIRVVVVLLNYFYFTFTASQSCTRLLLFRFKFLFIIILSIWRQNFKTFLSPPSWFECWRLNENQSLNVCAADQADTTYPDHHQRVQTGPGSPESPLPALAASSSQTCSTCPTCHSDTRISRKVCNEILVRFTVGGSFREEES